MTLVADATMPRRGARLPLAALLLLAAANVAPPSSAWAAPVEDRDTREAKKHFKKGEELYQAGHFDEALVEFQAAREARPLPALLYNVARCQEALGQTAEAIKSYQEYLSTAPDAEDVAPVVRHIEELQGGTPAHGGEDLDTALARKHAERGMKLYEEGRYELALSAFEDARQAKPLAAFYFDIARCLERMRRWDEARASYEEYLDAGPDPRDVDPVKQKIGELDQMIAAGRAHDAPPPSTGRHRIATWVLAAATVALGAGAGIAGGLAVSRAHESCQPGCMPPVDVNTPSYAAYGLAAGAGVALIATIIAAIVER